MKFYVPNRTSAQKPPGATLAGLRAGLNDSFHVWACVEFEKYEFDWFVLAERGWFGIFEEKDFPEAVRETAPSGAPWLLASGKAVPNPIEQVEHHCDAFRRFARQRLQPKFFPATDKRDVSIWRGVYSPKVTSETVLVQPRWGLFYEDLDDFVGSIGNLVPRTLVEIEDGNLPGLIEQLNHAFRAHLAGEPVAKTASSEGKRRKERGRL